MKKICFLAMCCLTLGFAACHEDKETLVENEKKMGSVYKSGTENGHDYVDLGLPSGTLWATCNVGASKPEEYGNRYFWGEVIPQEGYVNPHECTYKYSMYSGLVGLTKYTTNIYQTASGMKPDDKTVLESEDDVAHVNWGGKWKMPTKAQFEEIRSQCFMVETYNYNNSKVWGCIIFKAKTSSDKGKKIYSAETPSSSYSLSDAHIFLPAGDARNYWSSSLVVTERKESNVLGNCGAWCYYFTGSCYASLRTENLNVRAVIPGNK